MIPGKTLAQTGEPAGHSHHAAGPNSAWIPKDFTGARTSSTLYPEFAYFSTEDGVGWIRPDAWFSFDAGTNYYHFLEIKPEIKRFNPDGG